MNYRWFIYAFCLIITAFSCSGINFNGIFKNNHVLEAKIFMMLVIIAISYLVGSFIEVFIG